MSIYELLKKDHDEVKQMLTELVALNKDDDEARHELVENIRDAVVPHSRAEEMVFYNTLRSLEKTKHVVAHAYKEHLEAEALLRTLQLKDILDVDWKATAVKLKDALEHHFMDEEGRIFSAAKLVLSDNEVEMMGKAFEKLKPDIQKESFMGTTMDLVVNLMPPRFTSTFRKNHMDFNKH